MGQVGSLLKEGDKQTEIEKVLRPREFNGKNKGTGRAR